MRTLRETTDRQPRVKVCPAGFELSPQQFSYLHTCARIRNVSATYLMKEILRNVLDGELVLAVLDDDTQPHRLPYCHRYQWPRTRAQREIVAPLADISHPCP